MYLIISLFIFILGVIVGSFLNVVALRYNTGLSITKGRSKCFSCSKTLSWSELVPIFSFLYLKGKCSSCGSKVSWQYPIVEMITGILFLGVWIKNLPLLSVSSVLFVCTTILVWIIISVLVVISIYDIKHKIIPDSLVLIFIVASLLLLLGSLFLQAIPLVSWDLWAGPVLFLPFFLLWLVSSGRWIGLGDAKLAIGIGWFLGMVSGISAVVLAFWIGAGFSLILLGLGAVLKILHTDGSRLSFIPKGLTIKSEIPFAPFLILATLIVFFFNFDVVWLSALFQM
ncbi:MAG: prepilin peptidase [Parcubacteria group bacterium]|nr:prepilin peptidase [Parcubacteria group bacterium]